MLPLLLTSTAHAFVPLHIARKSQALQTKTENIRTSSQNRYERNYPRPTPSTKLFATQLQKPPVLAGDLVYPVKAVLNGLKNMQPCAAVYAVLDNTYKRGGATGDDWSSCVYIDGTQDLYTALSAHVANEGADSVSHVRVVSFSVRHEEKMVAQAREWVSLADGAGAKLVRDKWSQRILSTKPSFFYFCDFVDENEEAIDDECEIFYMSRISDAEGEDEEEVMGQVLEFSEVSEEIKAKAAVAKEKLAASVKLSKDAAEAKKLKQADGVSYDLVVCFI